MCEDSKMQQRHLTLISVQEATKQTDVVKNQQQQQKTGCEANKISSSRNKK